MTQAIDTGQARLALGRGATEVEGQPERFGQQLDIYSFLQILEPEIQRSMPAWMNPQRVTRIALTQVRRSEIEYQKGNSKGSLVRCNPQSFAGSLLTGIAQGFEFLDGDAWLVPYGDECTFIAGYKGMIAKYWEHPLAQDFDCGVIRQNDTWVYRRGVPGELTVQKKLGGEEVRGPIIGYFAVARLSTGAVIPEFLEPYEVEALRGGKVGPSGKGKITDPMRWMEIKEPVRQLYKRIPKTAQLRWLLDTDERTGSELYAERAFDLPPSRAALEAGPIPVDKPPQKRAPRKAAAKKAPAKAAPAVAATPLPPARAITPLDPVRTQLLERVRAVHGDAWLAALRVITGLPHLVAEEATNNEMIDAGNMSPERLAELQQDAAIAAESAAVQGDSESPPKPPTGS